MPVGKLCGGFLGKKGSRLMKELARSSTAEVTVGHRTSKRLEKKLLRMKSAPASKILQGIPDPRSVCEFRAPPRDVTSVEENLKFKYGWSKFPKWHKQRIYYYIGSTLLEVNYRPLLNGITVYFPCALNSEKKGIVKGTFRYQWKVEQVSGLTPEESDRMTARVMVATAATVSDALHCTNRPELPADGELTRKETKDELPTTESPLPKPPAWTDE